MIFTSVYLNVLLCLILLNKQWREQNSVLCLCLIIGMLLNSHFNVNVLAILLFQMEPLVYLIGPPIYFYGQSVYQNKLVFKARFLFLCLPSIIMFLNLLPYYQLSTAEKTYFISAVVNNNFFRSFPKEYTLLFDYKIQRAFNLAFILYTLYYLQKKKSNVLMKLKIAKITRSLVYIKSICTIPQIMYIIYASAKSPLQADLAFRLPTINYTKQTEICYLN